jgi:tetratricopeptide (TPR) repeat protein
MTVDVFTAACRAVPDHAVAVLVQAFTQDGDRVGLRATLHDKGTQRLLWAGTRLCGHSKGLPSDDLDLMHLGNQLIDALAEMLMLRARGDAVRRDSNLMGRLALRKIFSMRAGQLEEADDLLNAAYAMDPRGTFLAWRAQLRVIQHFERHRRDWPNLREAADDYCARALLAEPGNSLVLAAVANARLTIDRTPTTAIELARRGVQMNPASPLAWDTLAMAHLVVGDVAASHRVAARVQRLGAHAPNKFWWDMGLCITHTLAGRIEEAVQAAEASHAFAPDFRPPLRYLVALYAVQGRIGMAQAAAERLRRIEPDFDVDALIGDPDYPVQLLRRSTLLQADRLRAAVG